MYPLTCAHGISKQLWYFFWYPGLFGAVICVGMVIFNVNVFPMISSYLLHSLAERLPEWLLNVTHLWGWGPLIFSFILHVMLWVLSLLVLLIVFKPLILILLSPLFTRLSQLT